MYETEPYKSCPIIRGYEDNTLNNVVAAGGTGKVHDFNAHFCVTKLLQKKYKKVNFSSKSRKNVVES